MPHRQPWHLVFAWATMMAVHVLLLPEQFSDPFVRSDDYPALFPLPELFYWKTLAEGRWINWLWMLRPWPTDPQTLWTLYIGLWSLVSALVGVGVFPAARWPLGAIAVTLAFGLAPPVAMIANWFNTMIPANAILAAHAAVAVFGSARAARLALLAGVPMLLMCHTGYPFILLAIHAAIARPDGGWRETLGLLLWFVAALVAGLLLIYAINWAVHGHFGIQMAAWRVADPVRDLAGLLRNLAGLHGWAREIGQGLLLSNPLVGIPSAILVTLAMLSVGPAGRVRLGRVMLTWALSIGVVGAHIVQSGVIWPMRASGFLWFFALLIIALALVFGVSRLRRGLMLLALAGLVGIGALYWRLAVVGYLAPYQEFTRQIAARIGEVVPPGEPTLILSGGQALGLAQTQAIYDSVGLSFRLSVLTGLPTHLCNRQQIRGIWLDRFERSDGAGAVTWQADTGHQQSKERTAAACDPYREALAALPPYPQVGYIARLGPGVIGLRLPDHIVPDLPP